MCNITRTTAEECGHHITATIDRCQIAQRHIDSCEVDYDLSQNVVYDDSHQISGICERCHSADEERGIAGPRGGSPGSIYGDDEETSRVHSGSGRLASFGSGRYSPRSAVGNVSGQVSPNGSFRSGYSGSVGSFGVGEGHSDGEAITHMSGALPASSQHHGDLCTDIERLLRETTQEHERREEEELEEQMRRALEASAQDAPPHPQRTEEEQLAAALEASKRESSARYEEDEEELLRKALEASKADHHLTAISDDEEEQVREVLEASRLESSARHAQDEEAQLAAALAASKLSVAAIQEEDEEEAFKKALAASAAMHSHDFGGPAGAMGDSDDELERIKEQSMNEWHRSMWSSAEHDLDPSRKGKSKREQPPEPASEEEERAGGGSAAGGRGGQRKPNWEWDRNT